MEPAQQIDPDCSSPQLLIPARALMVAIAPERRAEIVRELYAAGIEPHIADDNLHRALQMLELDERFALMIVDLDGLGSEGQEFLTNACFEFPTIRKIALASGEGAGSYKESLKIPQTMHLIGTSLPAADIAECAISVLSDHHYDADVLGVIQRSLPHIMNGTSVAFQSPFLRASVCMLAPITAMIEIGGVDLWGRLLLSTHKGVASAYAEAQLERPPHNRDEVWDALGELANIFASDLREHYELRGLISAQSPPTIVESEHALVRQITSPLSVVVPFKHVEFAEPVYVEWIIAHKNPDQELGVPDDFPQESVTFL